MTDLVLRDVEVDGHRTDVWVRAGQIGSVGPDAPPWSQAEPAVFHGRGGALVPGLWDHHIHLMALAASLASVVVGPPAVTDRAGLSGALHTAARNRPDRAWIRAVGYHESVAGPLDAATLDHLGPDQPVRVQHRSGALWVLNSPASRQVGLDRADHPGVERDDEGRVTGRLFRADRWLRDRLPPADPPDLAAVGTRLATYGVTGVTDATPYEAPEDLELLASAGLPQRVVVTGGPALADHAAPPPLVRGPVKVLLADHDLPGLDEVGEWFETAHHAGRNVAVHCVTRASLVLALAAWEATGVRTGDRVEHASVAPPDLRLQMATMGLTVVTQPNFVAERGDQYLAEVEAEDRPHLYPCASLIEAGCEVGGSTDAPFGHPDPWRAVAAAIERRTPSGAGLGVGERLPPSRALGLFLSSPGRPGGPLRRVEPGSPADLCLLDAPLAQVLAEPDAGRVRATLVAGQLVAGS